MKKLLIAIAFVATFFAISAPVMAAENIFDKACQGQAATSEVCTESQNATSNPLVGPDGLITRITQLVVMAVGVVAIIVIIISGLRYILSAGEAAKISSAKDGLLYAVIGLIVAVVGQGIVSFVLQRL